MGEYAAARERERRGAGFFLWGIGVLLILYFLSPGPVLKIAPGIGFTFGGAFFWPLQKLCDYSPPVKGFYAWYVYRVWKVEWTA